MGTSAIYLLRTLDHQSKPLTKTLLKKAKELKIQIEFMPIQSGTAHFFAATNTVRIDAQKILSAFRQAGVKISPSRFIDEVIAHELVHGVIFSKLPNFDYRLGKLISRTAFDQPLENIIAHFPKPITGSRVEKIMTVHI